MPNEPVVSLCSGAMGLDLGLEQSGIQTTLAIEIDPHCCATMRRNKSELDVWQTGIDAIDGDAIRTRLGGARDVFLMAAGPPCQSFCPWREEGRPFRPARKFDLCLP